MKKGLFCLVPLLLLPVILNAQLSYFRNLESNKIGITGGIGNTEVGLYSMVAFSFCHKPFVAGLQTFFNFIAI